MMLHIQQLNVALLEKVQKKELRNVKLIMTKEFSRYTKGLKKKKRKKKSKAHSGHSGRLYESSTDVGVRHKVHHNKLACFILMDAKICSVIDAQETSSLFDQKKGV